MTCTGNEKFVSSALSYSDIKNEIDAIIQKKELIIKKI